MGDSGSVGTSQRPEEVSGTIVAQMGASTMNSNRFIMIIGQHNHALQMLPS